MNALATSQTGSALSEPSEGRPWSRDRVQRFLESLVDDMNERAAVLVIWSGPRPADDNAATTSENQPLGRLDRQGAGMLFSGCAIGAGRIAWARLYDRNGYALWDFTISLSGDPEPAEIVFSSLDVSGCELLTTTVDISVGPTNHQRPKADHAPDAPSSHSRWRLG